MLLGLSQDKWFLEPSYQGCLSPQTAPKPFRYLQVPPTTFPRAPRVPKLPQSTPSSQTPSYFSLRLSMKVV